MEFIDIHGHYAWNIDDGMPSEEDCKKALEIAKKQSITAIVATPHVIPGATTKVELESIKQRSKEFKELASIYGIQVYFGCELFLNHEYDDALYEGIYIPINDTKYLLAEFDVRKEIGSENNVEDRLYEIKTTRHIPIVAHVERYFHSKIDLDRVQNFIDEGYVIQVNTTSILGYNGKTIQNNVMKLLENGMVHVIATDTHRSEGRRVPNLLETYNYLQGKVSDSNLHLLMYDNPLAIINNQSVQPMTIEKKSFFKKLFG